MVIMLILQLLRNKLWLRKHKRKNLKSAALPIQISSSKTFKNGKRSLKLQKKRSLKKRLQRKLLKRKSKHEKYKIKKLINIFYFHYEFKFNIKNL